MKLGLGPYYISHYGMTEGARRMVKDGFAALDFQLADTDSIYYHPEKEGDFELTLVKIRRELEAAGVTVSQIHGPWRYPPRDADEEDRAERFEKMTMALVAARHLGAKYMAIHPIMPFGVEGNVEPEEVLRLNKQFFTALANVGQKLGVYVCLENMPFPEFILSSVENIVDFVKEVNHPYLKVCLDTGHANIFPTPIGECVRYVGKDLLAILHVHDNFGEQDSHNNPYDGTVDWADFVEALYDIGFEGVMNLETSPHINTDDPREREAEEKKFSATARLLAGI